MLSANKNVCDNKKVTFHKIFIDYDIHSVQERLLLEFFRMTRVSKAVGTNLSPKHYQGYDSLHGAESIFVRVPSFGSTVCTRHLSVAFDWLPCLSLQPGNKCQTFSNVFPSERLLTENTASIKMIYLNTEETPSGSYCNGKVLSTVR